MEHDERGLFVHGEEEAAGKEDGVDESLWWQSCCFAFACCVLAVFEICLLWRTRKSCEEETT